MQIQNEHVSKILYNSLIHERTSEILKSVQSASEKLGVYGQFNKGMVEKIAGLGPKLFMNHTLKNDLFLCWAGSSSLRLQSHNVAQSLGSQSKAQAQC